MSSHTVQRRGHTIVQYVSKINIEQVFNCGVVFVSTGCLNTFSACSFRSNISFFISLYLNPNGTSDGARVSMAAKHWDKHSFSAFRQAHRWSGGRLNRMQRGNKTLAGGTELTMHLRRWSHSNQANHENEDGISARRLRKICRHTLSTLLRGRWHRMATISSF